MVAGMTLWRTHPVRIALALSAAMFAIPVITALLVPRPLEQPFGVDFILYRDAAARWLAGGPYFEPYQLAGPYPITAGDVLYPPVALWLFVPFTVLPAVLWWVIPVAVTAWAIWRLRPMPAWWPLIALCIAWPTTLLKTWTGNPVLWSVTAMALGVVFWWPSVFVLLKPSLFPFALFGANRRSWWLGARGVRGDVPAVRGHVGRLGDDAREFDRRRAALFDPRGPDAVDPAGRLARARTLSRPRAATFDGLTVAPDPEPRPYRPDMGHRPGGATSVAFRSRPECPWTDLKERQRWTVAIPPGC